MFSLDPDVGLSHLSTMDEVRNQLFIGDKFTMMLYGGFALVALMLAAIGVYGVISFGVSQRNQEIGLRMALGAQTGTIARLIVWEACVLAFIGLGLGVLGSMWLGHLMQSTLYAVRAFGFFGICVRQRPLTVDSVVGSLPSGAPAASSVSPMRALRTE